MLEVVGAGSPKPRRQRGAATPSELLGVDLEPEPGRFRSHQEPLTLLHAVGPGLTEAVGELCGGRGPSEVLVDHALEKFGPSILADLEIWGVERWELWGLELRARIKVLPRERDNVRREFLRRLVGAFDAHGIKTP